MKMNQVMKQEIESIVLSLCWIFPVSIEEKTPDDYFQKLSEFVDISKYDKRDLICAGVTSCKEVDGKDEVQFFVDGVLEVLSRLGHVDLGVVVKHEWRHSLQFAWLRQQGGANLVKRVLNDEIASSYGQGVLEYDAKLFSEKGINRPFEEVFAEYLAA